MSTRRAKLGIATATTTLLCAGVLAWAAGPAASSSPPSKEQREKMAQAHEKMAACLRSDRPVADCHQEMMQTCRDTMGGQGCGMMMGQGPMRGRGMMRGQGGAGKPTPTTQP